VNGTNGVSGYQVVKKVYSGVSVPSSGNFRAQCPAGKKVLGGGGHVTVVQGFAGGSITRPGAAPLTSEPDGETGWLLAIDERLLGGADITVLAVCASVGP